MARQSSWRSRSSRTAAPVILPCHCNCELPWMNHTDALLRGLCGIGKLSTTSRGVASTVSVLIKLVRFLWQIAAEHPTYVSRERLPQTKHWSADPKLVQLVMRHTKLDMTMYYAHASRVAKREAQGRVLKVLTSGARSRAKTVQ